MAETEKKSDENKEKKAIEPRKGELEEIVPYFGSIQREFDRMMERFESEFENFWDIPSRWRHGARWKGGFPMMPFREPMMPSVDLEDRGKDFRLTVDLPGFRKEDINLEIEEDSVTIKAKRSEATEEKEKDYIRKERRAQTFYRRVPLPEKVRSDDTKANLNKGTLEVTLPKMEPKEARKIEISEQEEAEV